MGPEVIRTLLLVSGMKDNHCRESVSEALKHVNGVTEVQVNLYRAQAMVVHESKCVAADLIQAVGCLGYPATLQGKSKSP